MNRSISPGPNHTNHIGGSTEKDLLISQLKNQIFELEQNNFCNRNGV